MQGKRLLERLRALNKNPDWRGDLDTNLLMSSIMGHLQKILNTRQGTVPIATDYGIPDFSSLATMFNPSEMPHLEQSLANIITHYEPRLTNVRVHFTPMPSKPMTMVFQLQAQLRIPDSPPVSFETILCPDGHVEIKE